jgi:hypothetical protein
VRLLTILFARNPATQSEDNQLFYLRAGDNLLRFAPGIVFVPAARCEGSGLRKCRLGLNHFSRPILTRTMIPL